MYLCTLAQARDKLKTDQTAADTDLLETIPAVSDRFAQLYPFALEPMRDTRYFNISRQNLSPDGLLLYLDYPLLELESVAVSGVDVDTATYQVSPPSQLPTMELEKTDGVGWANGAVTVRNAIAVTGWWGHHHNYRRAFKSGTTLSSNVNASVTSIPVASAALFSPGHLVRCGDELWRVLAVVTTPTASLTVDRAENGTDAAAHTSGAAVTIYTPDPSVTRSAARQTAYWAHRRGAFESTRIDLQAGIAVTYEADLLAEMTAVINALPGYIAVYPVLPED